MESTVKQVYSKKSRSIMFNFKKCLKDNGLTLKELCFNVFSYEKEKFSRSEFTQLIKEIDDRLSFQDIDHLIESLDPDGNGIVSFATFQRALGLITEADDPFNNQLDLESSRIVERSRVSGKVSDQEKAILLLKEIKDRIKGSDPYQLLDLFDANRDGMFDHKQFDEFALNYGISQKNDREILRKHLYGKRDMLTYKQFIKRLELEGVPKRVRFEDLENLENKKSHIIPPKKLDPKSIKPILKKNTSRTNLLLDEDDEESGENKPNQLAPFINKISELTEPLQSMALQCIKDKKVFMDKKPASAGMAHHYEFASSIFGRDYLLFAKAPQSKSVLTDKSGQSSKLGSTLQLNTKEASQGAIHSQYLLSSIASLASRYPEMLYRNFPLLKNPAAIYGIKLFIDGRWKTVITDAFFPVDSKNKLVYATSGSEDIWIMLIEKAMAKIYRSYENIHIGFADEGLNVLTGAPVERFSAAEAGVLDFLKKELQRKSIVCVSGSSLIKDTIMDNKSVLGLSAGRVYTILDVFKDVPADDGKPVTLIKLRSPEGKLLEWSGDWSFSSPKWSTQLRSRLGYAIEPNDGSFFLDAETFRNFFGQATTCCINPTYVNSHIRIYAGRTHSHMLEFTVKKEGTYFLSLYQDSKRKFAQSHNYEKSKARMFVAFVRDGRLQAIRSKAIDNADLHQQFVLKPGTYIMSCKVKWKFFDKYHFVVTSYGPHEIEFKEIRKNKQFLPAFIKCRAMARYAAAKKEFYNNIGLPQSFRAWEMLPREGFGYILISNPSDKAIECTLNFSKCEGIKALKPQRFPMVVQVPPNQIAVRGLLVDPSGYSYVLDENRRIVGDSAVGSTNSIK